MIKRILLPLMAVLLMASCSDKFGMMKRRYNKGYYVAHRSHSSTPKEQIAVKTITNEAPETVVVKQEETVKTTPTVARQPETKMSALSFIHKKDDKYHSASSVNTVALANASNAIPVKHELTKSTQIQSKGAQKKSNDTDLIVQIILALFPILCLIAVYLHDGKAITLNFWIDLLLHLTVIGEIIFAILVVLDIVDLK